MLFKKQTQNISKLYIFIFDKAFPLLVPNKTQLTTAILLPVKLRTGAYRHNPHFRCTQPSGRRRPTLRHCKIENKLNNGLNLKIINLRDQANHESSKISI